MLRTESKVCRLKEFYDQDQLYWYYTNCNLNQIDLVGAFDFLYESTIQELYSTKCYNIEVEFISLAVAKGLVKLEDRV